MNIQGKVWGETMPLFNKNNVEVHFIRADKGGFCSKHYHKSKFNKFIVMYGKLKISTWKQYGNDFLEDITILHPQQECTVAPGDYHRFEALEDTQALEIYWVDLNENDIVREDQGGMILHETKTNERTEDTTVTAAYSPKYSAIFTANNHFKCSICEQFHSIGKCS